jgi:hypothetical protein
MDLDYIGYKRYVNLESILGDDVDSKYSLLQGFIDSLGLDNLKIKSNGLETVYFIGKKCLFKTVNEYLIMSEQEIYQILKFDFLMKHEDIKKLVIYLFNKYIGSYYSYKNTYISSNINYYQPIQE